MIVRFEQDPDEIDFSGTPADGVRFAESVRAAITAGEATLLPKSMVPQHYPFVARRLLIRRTIEPLGRFRIELPATVVVEGPPRTLDVLARNAEGWEGVTYEGYHDHVDPLSLADWLEPESAHAVFRFAKRDGIAETSE